MTQPYVGEIAIFAGDYVWSNWAECDGQVFDANQHALLYYVLGNTYGGQKGVSLALPDLRGRLPIGSGAGPGLSHREPGDAVGANTVALDQRTLPRHGHRAWASNETAAMADPHEHLPADPRSEHTNFQMYTDGTPDGKTAPSLSDTGSSAPHANMMPSMGLTFLISLLGVAPSHQS